MKLAKSALFVASSALAASIPPNTVDNYVQKGIFIEKNFIRDGSTALADFNSALEAGYNTFYVGFYMANYGCQAACLEWTLTLTDSQRSQIKSNLAAAGAKLYLSVGGPSELWENTINAGNAASLGQQIGTFAAANMFDGVEFSMNLAGQGTIPSSYYDNGSFNQLCKDLASNVKSAGGFARTDLAISAGAPYFSLTYAKNNVNNCLASLCYDNNESQSFSIGTCNLLMFDEDGNYMTYNDVFVQNSFTDPIKGTFGQGSSVKEVSAQGISSSKIGVIKPTDSAESTVRSGYVTPKILGDWGCQANYQYGWTGGFVAWTWNDKTSSDLQQTLSFVTQTAYCPVSN